MLFVGFFNDILSVLIPLVLPLVFTVCFFGVCIEHIRNKKTLFDAPAIFVMFLLVFSLTFSSVFGGCYPFVDDPISEDSGCFEKAIYSFISSLKIFTLNANAMEWVDSVKEATYIACNKTWVSDAYGIVAGFLCAIAPISVGLFLLEIIAEVFPKSRILWGGIVRKRIYIFSDLNEHSLHVAKDILKNENWVNKNWSTIIFTDVYSNKSSEFQNEIINKAKAIGAICVKEDITTLQKVAWLGQRVHIVLCDTYDERNLKALCELAIFSDNKYFNRNFGDRDNIRVYVFFSDDTLLDTYHSAQEKLNEKVKFVRRVDPVQDSIYEILDKHPLYKAIDTERENKQLLVAIIGTGEFGTKMFLNSYWCGQLCDVDLHLNILSSEKQQEFEKRIDAFNPEIFESTKKDSEILKPAEGENPHPYFNFGYLEGNAFCTDFKSAKFHNHDEFFNSDYIFISIGTDAQDIALANKIRREFEISQKKDSTIKIPTIICVVSNASVADCVNHPIDCLDISDMGYSYATVFKDTEDKLAKLYGDEYDVIYGKKCDHADLLKKEYNLDSNVSKAIHLPYRAVSAFLIEKEKLPDYKPYLFVKYMSLLKSQDKSVNQDVEIKESLKKGIHNKKGELEKDLTELMEKWVPSKFKKEHKRNVRELNKKIWEYDSIYQMIPESDSVDDLLLQLSNIDYRSKMRFGKKKNTSLEGKARQIINEIRFEMIRENDKDSVHAKIRWLEHRRWNAYLRSKGYRYWENEGENEGKDLNIKLHHDLTEFTDRSLNPKPEKTVTDIEKKEKDIIYDEPCIFDVEAIEKWKEINQETKGLKRWM